MVRGLSAEDADVAAVEAEDGAGGGGEEEGEEGEGGFCCFLVDPVGSQAAGAAGVVFDGVGEHEDLVDDAVVEGYSPGDEPEEVGHALWVLELGFVCVGLFGGEEAEDHGYVAHV